MANGLSIADLERAYDLIAAAIDRTPANEETDFLARLTLTLAARQNSLADLESALRIAESAIHDRP
jgi:hypothetical protein